MKDSVRCGEFRDRTLKLFSFFGDNQVYPFMYTTHFLKKPISNILARYSICSTVIRCHNPLNNFFGLSLDKTDHVRQNRTMVIRHYPPSNLISVAKKRASVQAKLLLGHGKQKNIFCRSQWHRNEKAGWQFCTKKHEKISKIYRNDLHAFTLRNYSEGYQIYKPLSSLLVYWRTNATRWKIVPKISQ